MTPLPVVARQIFRRWTRRPSFPLSIVLVLTVAVAASAAGFSFIDKAILRRLTWPDATRLVSVHAVVPAQRSIPAFSDSWDRSPVSWETWTRLESSEAFDGVGAYFETRQILRSGIRPQVINTTYLSSKLLVLLGWHARMGRLFVGAEDQDTGSQTAIISTAFWQRHFNGRPDIVGQPVPVAFLPSSATETYVIVGVFDGDFVPRSAAIDVGLPIGRMSFNGSFSENAFLRVVGRISERSDRKAAEDQATVAVAAPGTGGRTAARLVPIAQELADAVPSWWLVLWSCVLLQMIACVAVAGLFWSEVQLFAGQTRILIAIGADRASLIWRTAVEFVGLSILAWGAGLAGAAFSLRILDRFTPDGSIGLNGAGLTWWSMMVALACCLATALVAGILPAWHMIGRIERNPRPGLGQALSLKLQKRTSALAVALSFMFVTGALVLGATMLRTAAEPLGFDPSRLVVASIRYARDSMGDRSATREDADRQALSGWLQTSALIDRIGALGGVQEVAGAASAPFANSLRSTTVKGVDSQISVTADAQVVTERYFAAIGARIVAGRAFEPRDRASQRAAIVSENFARSLFPGGAVGGRFLRLTQVYDVIGVVADLKHQDPVERPRPVFYEIDQTTASVTKMVIRMRSADSLSLATIRTVIESFDPGIVVEDVTLMESLIARKQSARQLRGFLSGAYAVAALGLVVLSLYAVSMRLTTERRREFALRLALGAPVGRVRRLLVDEVVLVLLKGLAIGIPMSLAMLYLVRAFVFDMTSQLLPALGVGVLASLAATVVAAAVPAVRASRIDPGIVLRD